MEAARTAAWWHGRAAEIAVARHGMLGATWERLIDALPAAIQMEMAPSPLPGLTRLV
jgi:NAD(P)H-hydrate repair Nnr-like enzyme with NAD(P)H-hydrate dehydratase domain